MTRLVAFTLIATAIGLGCSSADPPTCETVSPALAHQALDALRADGVIGATPGTTALLREVERELRELRATHYAHVTSVDERSGEFDFDCSGFLGYALSRALPATWDAVRARLSDRPVARDFVSFFSSLGPREPEFTRVMQASDIHAGDIVAWLESPGAPDTGHVGIVAAAPTPSPDRPDELLVPIVDSASHTHASADTRAAGENGLGVGTIGILVDQAGQPTGHRWAGGCGDDKSFPIVVARAR